MNGRVPGCGNGAGTPSDFFDALTVAVDALHRAWAAEGRPDLLKKSVAKRILLVSSPSRGDCMALHVACMRSYPNDCS